MEEMRRAEATRLLQWIRGHQSDWKSICDSGGEVEEKQLYRLLKEMFDQSFYQIALILISSCSLYPKGERATRAAMMDLVLKGFGTWDIVDLTEKILKNYDR